MAVAETYSADLRAPSIEAQRRRNHNAKYDSFRNVNEGQIGALHYTPSDYALDSLALYPASFEGANVVTVSKRTLWLEAKFWASGDRSYGRYDGGKHGLTCKRMTRVDNTIAMQQNVREVERVVADSQWDPEALAEADLRELEMMRIATQDYDDVNDQIMEDSGSGEFDLGPLVDCALQKFDEKKAKDAQRRGWDLVSDVASVCSEDFDTGHDRGADDSDFEFV
ncbi:MAG: hypothetical protein M1820_006817 [Bogoriella megaspora]|nr:MAG: hypothetical protein M1820_006817 [Bogoriella megaspora]